MISNKSRMLELAAASPQLLLLLLLLLMGSVCLEAKNALERVEKDLEARLDPNEATVDQFVAEAGKLLEESEHKLLVKTFNKDYLEQLEAFSRLEETVNRCNENSQQILDDNHRLTNNRVLVPRSKLPEKLGIVEEILHQYSYNNGLYCTSRLVLAAANTNRRLLQKKLVFEALGLVRALGKAQLEREHGAGWAGAGAELIESLFVLTDLGGSSQDGQVARRALAKLTRRTQFESLFALPKGRNSNQTKTSPGRASSVEVEVPKMNKEFREQVRLAMMEYLGKPCGLYVDGLREIFSQVQLDFQVLEDEEKPEFASNVDFYRTWAQYRLCQIGLDNFDKLLGSTLAAIKQLQS